MSYLRFAKIIAVATCCVLWLEAALVLAEQPKRVGLLLTTILPEEKEAFQRGMREVGYVEGRTLILDWRLAKGDYSSVPTLARELVASKPDVIVTESTPATKAAMAATPTIPIIMVAPGDPVGSGLVQSLAHPGRNVTGLSLMLPEVSIKQLGLLMELIPTLKRVGVIWDPSVEWHRRTIAGLEATAHNSGRLLTAVPVQRLTELDGAFSRLRQARVEALCFVDSSFYVEERKAILAVARRSRLPVMYPEGVFVHEGGLISYSADSVDLFRRAAYLVDRVLKGERPGDLPVQQPVKFELFVNERTARSLGLSIPKGILERADEVIR